MRASKIAPRSSCHDFCLLPVFAMLPRRIPPPHTHTHTNSSEVIAMVFVYKRAIAGTHPNRRRRDKESQSETKTRTLQSRAAGVRCSRVPCTKPRAWFHHNRRLPPFDPGEKANASHYLEKLFSQQTRGPSTDSAARIWTVAIDGGDAAVIFTRHAAKSCVRSGREARRTRRLASGVIRG